MIVCVMGAIGRALARWLDRQPSAPPTPAPPDREPPLWLPRVGLAAMAVTVTGAAVAGAVSSSALVAVTIAGVLVMMLCFGMWMAPPSTGAFITVAATSVAATLAVVGGLVALSRVTLHPDEESPTPEAVGTRQVTVELTDKGQETILSMCGVATQNLSAEAVKVEGRLFVVEAVRQCDRGDVILPMDGVEGTTSK